jgi:hypothetical protein
MGVKRTPFATVGYMNADYNFDRLIIGVGGLINIDSMGNKLCPVNSEIDEEE